MCPHPTLGLPPMLLLRLLPILRDGAFVSDDAFVLHDALVQEQHQGKTGALERVTMRFTDGTRKSDLLHGRLGMRDME